MDTVQLTDVLTRRKRTRKVTPDMDIATCGTCGRSWDDAISTHLTPTPAARCPFEDMHATAPKRKARTVQSQFTPGPWAAIRTVGRNLFITAETESVVYVALVYEGQDVNRANAALIAAAPDLLAACEAAVEANDTEPLMTPWYMQLCAAIAKARGE